MIINVIGKAIDIRTTTTVVYAQMNIADYLDLVGDDFDKFAIQRRREKHKAYPRLRADIIAGALLPTITLAVQPDRVKDIMPYIEPNDDIGLAKALAEQGIVNILDGLQRTYILQELKSSGVVFKDGQKLLLEFWLEPNINNLIYRIIVLNAGQKPMSMRHQIEVLFATFKELLEKEVLGLELFKENEGSRRTKAKKYSFERIVTAYQSFLSKTPEIQKENIVAQHLVEEDILSESEEQLSDKYEAFKKYIRMYTELDEEICKIYDGSLGSGVLTGTIWFGSENVMNSFFAAIADFGSSKERLQRIDSAFLLLKEMLSSADVGSDPLGLKTLQDVIQGFNTRKVNVGFATRKLLATCFKEFFREEGQRRLSEIWAYEAE